MLSSDDKKNGMLVGFIYLFLQALPSVHQPYRHMVMLSLGSTIEEVISYDT